MMKHRILTYCLMGAAIFAVHAAATRISAQEMVGAYADMPANSKDAKRAAAFAVKQRSAHDHKAVTLIKIVKAEHQVVAGTNYRICMRVREGKARSHMVTAVVYQNLKDRRSLSKWKAGACAEL